MKPSKKDIQNRHTCATCWMRCEVYRNNHTCISLARIRCCRIWNQYNVFLQTARSNIIDWNQHCLATLKSRMNILQRMNYPIYCQAKNKCSYILKLIHRHKISVSKSSRYHNIVEKRRWGPKTKAPHSSANIQTTQIIWWCSFIQSWSAADRLIYTMWL